MEQASAASDVSAGAVGSGPVFGAFAPVPAPRSVLRDAITAAILRPERACLPPLLAVAQTGDEAFTQDWARRLTERLRVRAGKSGVEGLLNEYALASDEGVALMCLAEALLRIPDTATRDALIRDKLAGGDWLAHLGWDRPLFVNAATWGLMITGRITAAVDADGLGSALGRLVARFGEPVIRAGLDVAMRLLGEQFVAGVDIDSALKLGAGREQRGYRHSYDMLGEAALTAEDAANYDQRYQAALQAVGAAAAGRGALAAPGVSVKLSALHPRYGRAQAGRVLAELGPRLRRLALLAMRHDIGLTIDAEEADRLELSLDLFEALRLDPELAGWSGLGIVVQAYGKRCPFVIDWLADLAGRSGARINVRLVKGAYWDTEIKRAQINGLRDFPVFTRKVYTDVSWLACARKLLDAGPALFPQFATHNARSVASILAMTHDRAPDSWEFQCLHGMGEPLYDQLVAEGAPCRIYAPVGPHDTLLAYLVRRLLENGANSSFVRLAAEAATPLAALISDPVAEVTAMADPGAPHPAISAPPDLFRGAAAQGRRRGNSAGLDLSCEADLATLTQGLVLSASLDWRSGPIVACACEATAARRIVNPGDHADVVGEARDAPSDAAASIVAAARPWAGASAADRADCLRRAAGSLEAAAPELIGLIMREAGKTAANALGEVREAVDFLRYYAAEAGRHGAGSGTRVGAPLGVVLCISPWNFPLAIFVGQVAAALAAGNAVIAKPSEETPLNAAAAVRLLHADGVPTEALQLAPGDGAVGAALAAQPGVAGVLFTGSTAVARKLNLQLAARATDVTPVLVAETGGLNCMVVDSSALVEQVVADVLTSAFDSAGQRCSALRVLCLQEDIADVTLTMLRGAMRELTIGRTDRLAVDVGPVISEAARQRLEQHVARLAAMGRKVERLPLPPEAQRGTFVAPTLIEIDSLADVPEEAFGPVLHVLRWRRQELEPLLQAINATGYGLTFGLHTRLDGVIDQVTRRIRAGNIYVNRNMVGAVVGVQPFGGRGLSGTGPKAGGPLMLRRLRRAVAKGPGLEDGGHVADVALPPLSAMFADWLEQQGETRLAQAARDMARRARAVCTPIAAGAPAPAPGGGCQVRPASAASARADDGARPAGRRVRLPGPVGEANDLLLRPAAPILLAPQTGVGLYAMIAAALACDAEALIVGGAGLAAARDRQALCVAGDAGGRP